MNSVRKLRVIADMEYSPVRSGELKDLADEIEREHMDDVNIYLDNEAKLINRIERLRKAIEYALNPDADREAAAGWVEEHGGIVELDKRLMPPGMEWPRFEDGKQITWNNSPDHTAAICLALDGSCYSLHYDMPDDEIMCIYEGSERVKRPVTEVLAADGLPIKVGDTVYCEERYTHVGGEDVVKATGKVEELVLSNKGCEVYVDSYDDSFPTSCIHHTKPDSWEQIEADAYKNYMNYFGCSGFACADCPSKIDGVKPYSRYETDSCELAMRKDVVRRAKALSERGA